MTFKHLDVPPQWQHYWTKYPEGYTILEALINWVNQVNNMSDSLNTSNLRLDDFIKQFDTELQTTVGDILTEMKEDGTLADVINNDVFNNISSRLDDYALHVNDYTTPAEAVADAILQNRPLDWGNENYTVSDSITNFHTVQHYGRGAILRDGATYYLAPTNNQENKLYVNAATGNDLNDGISPNTGLRTIQKAFDILALNAHPVLRGSWRIIVAAGTYSRARLLENLPSEHAIIIEGSDVGGHPNVPTTVINEGPGTSAMGLRFDGAVKVKVKNIKLQGFNGTTSSAGINVAGGTDLVTENVHTESCFYGVSGQRSNIEIPDGLHTKNGTLVDGSGSGAAIRSLQLNRHHVGKQNNGSQTGVAIFRENKTGVFAQESSTGHIDWCTFEDNTDAVVVRVNARANLDGSLFNRNFNDIRAEGNSHVYVSTKTTFGTGTNESNNKIIAASGAQLTTSRLTDKEVAYSAVDSSFVTEYLNYTHTSSATAAFYTLSLKTPFWRSLLTSVTPMKRLKFRLIGELTGTGGAKRVQTRLGSSATGGLAAITYSSSEVGSFIIDGYIYFVDQQKQITTLNSNRHLTYPRQFTSIATNDLLSDTPLTFEAQVDAPTTDSVKIHLLEISYAG